ncbi:MAG: phage major capsid protein, partial [Planctomycetes bacterium]|nr:phage major capsid protein [Planctomycetota bacterium]
QIFNNSEGYLLQCSGNHTANVIPVAGATREQWLALVIGMEVDIGPTALAKDNADGVVISAVSRTNETITVTGTITGTLTTADYIRMHDSYDNTNARTVESTGLREIVSSGDSLFTINGATVPAWNSYVDDNSGTNRTPTEDLYIEALDEVSIESGMVPNLAVAPHDVVRNYAAQLQSQKRFIDNVELKGGHSALPISSGSATIGLIADRFCTGNTSYLLSTSELTWNKAADWEWMDEDGAVLNRIPNKDAYEATMFSYCELTTS